MPHTPPKTPKRSHPDIPGDYEVGYGRPPQHTRFKPGQCGNPRGRPRKDESLATHVKAAMAQKVRVTDGDRSRRISKSEIIATGLVNRAAKGSIRDLVALIQFFKGSEFAPGMSLEAALDNGEAQAVIDLYFKTHYQKPQPDGEA
jgi:hypothetical protein